MHLEHIHGCILYLGTVSPIFVLETPHSVVTGNCLAYYVMPLVWLNEREWDGRTRSTQWHKIMNLKRHPLAGTPGCR